MTSSTGRTKIFPSPIFLTCAARSMASTTFATWSSSTTTSIFTLGRKSTDVLGALVELGVAALPAEPLHLAGGQAVHADSAARPSRRPA